MVTLTFNILTLKLVRIIAREMGNLPISFGVYGTFRSLTHFGLGLVYVVKFVLALVSYIRFLMNTKR